LEKVLGNDRYQSLTWYLNGLVRCRAVAQIQDTSANGIGTGFLVRGADLHPALPDQVLVTNGHVIPEDLHPADAVVVFHGRHRRRAQRDRRRARHVRVVGLPCGSF
jgi:S1-C subfamily serine protease